MRNDRRLWPWRQRITPAHTLLVALVCLIGLSVNIVIPRSHCSEIAAAHRKVIDTLRQLRPAWQSEELAMRATRPDPELQPLLTELRQHSSRLQWLYVTAGKCGRFPSVHHHHRRHPSSLEFSLASRYPTDGVLLYLISVLGSTRRSFVEIDSAHGNGFFGAASVFAFAYNWTVFAMHESWTSYEAARVFYEQSPYVTVIDTDRLWGRATQIAQQHGFGGGIDVAAIFPGGGDDLSVLHDLAIEYEKAGWIRPRILFLFFQDYWGDSDRVRVSNATTQLFGVSDGVDTARARLYVGGSLPAVVRITRAAGYRMVWCLADTPIAFFVDQRASVGTGLLPTISVNKCLRKRYSPMWRRDAEAMWDEAQAFDWTRG